MGLGKVGKALAQKLTALGMNVNAIRRSLQEEVERQLGVQEAGDASRLCELASEADFVISTISLSPETRGMFDRKLFNAMAPRAYFVNVSRGPVVNEEDLIDALKEGRIAGAGLDVFTVEPVNPDNPLLKMPNVFATPHVAGATEQNYDGIASVVAANITLFKEGKAPRFCVNRELIEAK